MIPRFSKWWACDPWPRRIGRIVAWRIRLAFGRTCGDCWNYHASDHARGEFLWQAEQWRRIKEGLEPEYASEIHLRLLSDYFEAIEWRRTHGGLDQRTEANFESIVKKLDALSTKNVLLSNAWDRPTGGRTH